MKSLLIIILIIIAIIMMVLGIQSNIAPPVLTGIGFLIISAILYQKK